MIFFSFNKKIKIYYIIVFLYISDLRDLEMGSLEDEEEIVSAV